MRDEVGLFVEHVLDTADSAYRRAAMALSVCLASRPDDLRDLVGQLWSDGAVVAEAVDRVVVAPFVETTAAGCRINSDLVEPFIGRFMNEDQVVFERAHEILADREREAMLELADAEPDVLEMERWFVQGRLAFYLAGVHSDESVERFGLAFESAPPREATPSRLWLSTLVFRQRPLLGEHSRAIAFFEGFRAYVAGRRTEALSYLNEVIVGDSEDLYQAIGLHLYAICLYKPSDRIHDLTKSVELSERLELSENAVIARNSLAAAHLAMATELKRSGKGPLSYQHLRQAETLSEVNLQQARTMPIRGYQAYALNERATVRWALAAGTDGRRGMTPQAQNSLPVTLSELSQAISIADSVGLSDTALYARNERASVLRDAGRIGEALTELEVALGRINSFTGPTVVTRLKKTAGSLQFRITPDLASRLAALRERLDELSLPINTSLRY